MTNARLRVAVAGCGVHGTHHHLANYARFPDVEVVGVCDANPDRAAAAAAQYGVAHWYADHRALLDAHRPEVVSVCTPPASHCAITRDALAAGADVLCEKPLAASLAEAETMVEAARRHGRLLSIGLQTRYVPAAAYLRELIASGRLGRVFHSRVWCGHVMNIPGGGVFHRKDLSVGGVIYATAVHILDAALWMLGSPTPVAVVGALYQKVSHMPNPPITWKGRLEDMDVEDFGVGFVRFANGSTMTLEANWLTHPCSRATGIHFLADRGSADYLPLRVEVEDGAQVIDITPALPAADPPPSPLMPVLRDFLDCVRTRRTPMVRFRELLDTQRIMDAIYRSAETGREVAVGE
ncbi:MAG: Gfo/Idh/MocA family oxidoreductase [Chloroflexi bacterium]|nr:Gfo/Idh/MocA family oxidoreductase [Chloroflexota bacterium]